MNTLPLTQECQLNALEIELANVQAQLTQAQQQINHLQHDLFTEQTTNTQFQKKIEEQENNIVNLFMKSVEANNKRIQTSRENEELKEENEKLRQLGLKHLLERMELEKKLKHITEVAVREEAETKKVLGDAVAKLQQIQVSAEEQKLKFQVVEEKAKKYDWLCKRQKKMFNNKK